MYGKINNSHILQFACEGQPKLYTEALKTKEQEPHANGRPLSTGITVKVCVCVSEAIGMEDLLGERNQWGRGLCVCVREKRRGYINNGWHCLPISLVH